MPETPPDQQTPFVIPAPVSKPPKQYYDKVRDYTVCQTNETKFHSGSSFSYAAAYRYRGTTPIQPESVYLSFFALRTSTSTDANKDADVAGWTNVSTVTMRWGKDPEDFKAEYAKIPQRNDFINAMNNVLGARSYYEQLRVEVPVAKFYQLAHAKEVLVALGDYSDSLGEKTLKPLKQLAESIPAK